MTIKLLTYLTTYLIIVLCELGDKTQLAVLLLTSRNPKSRWLLFTASALALSLCVLVEVSAGKIVAQHIAPHMINKLAGAVFLLMGAVGLSQEFLQHHKLKISAGHEICEKAR